MTESGSGKAPATFETSDGLTLARRSWVASHPKARVTLIHGLGDHSGRYDELGRALVSAGYAVHSYDQRGHGLSPGRRGDTPRFDRFVDDLDGFRSLLEHEAGEQRVPEFLLGHSMGGLIVLRYLQLHRPSLPGAVMSAPWLATAARIPPWQAWGGRIAARVMPGLQFNAGFEPSKMTRDPEMVQRREMDELAHSIVTPRLFQQAERTQKGILAEMDEVNVPCLFLVPGDDAIASSDTTLAFATGLAGGPVTVHELPDCRHEPFNEIDRADTFDTVALWFESRLQRIGYGLLRPPVFP